MARGLVALAVAAFSLLPSVRADFSFSSPTAGQIISGSIIDVEFTEGTGSPPMANFNSYILQLCAGGNGASDFTPIMTFTTKGDPTKTSFTATITNLAVGGNTANAYFLQLTGDVATGGTVINYSSRFTLSDMTGQFDPTVQQGLAKVGTSNTAGPATQNHVANPAAQAPAAGPGSFSLAYTMQTGPIRYAPMAVKAPSQITAKGNARQFPTSSYSVYLRSGMPLPDATQTVTNSYTYSVSSREATMGAQTAPNDMEKFLNRWKD